MALTIFGRALDAVNRALAMSAATADADFRQHLAICSGDIVSVDGEVERPARHGHAVTSARFDAAVVERKRLDTCFVSSLVHSASNANIAVVAITCLIAIRRSVVI